MFRYWTELRGRRNAPEREEIDPAALRKVLGDSVRLSFNHGAGHPIRLAGTRVGALFGRELKALPFISLWHPASRPRLQSLVAHVCEGGAAVVASAAGRTPSGVSVPLEMLLLPLSRGTSLDDHVVGVLAPLGFPAWIGARPIEALVLAAFQPVAPARMAASDRTASPRAMPMRAGLAERQRGTANSRIASRADAAGAACAWAPSRLALAGCLHRPLTSFIISSACPVMGGQVMAIAPHKPSPAEISEQRFQRVSVNLLGRYMLENRREFPCQVTDMSPVGMAVIAPVNGGEGEKVIAYVDRVGRLEGMIARVFDNGFAMDFTATARKRDKLAARLARLADQALADRPHSHPDGE